jgi:hypothetical protein
VGFVEDKVALGRFPASASVFHAYHSTNCSALIIIIHHPGLVQYAEKRQMYQMYVSFYFKKLNILRREECYPHVFK